MGVAKLQEWLKTQNIKLDPNDPYDLKSMGRRTNGRDVPKPDFTTEGMLIDTPDLLHYIAQKVYHYGIFEELGPIDPKTSDVELEIEYLNELVNVLETYIDEFQPKQYFIVSIDGAVPLGKIYEQRRRRFASMGEMTTPRWTSMNLTPGTAFMSKVNTKLREWFESYSKLPPYSIYSGYQVPGEGEHKMFRYLKDALKSGDIVEGTGFHIYTGQDGDLLMIGSLVPVKNLIWLKQHRDTKKFVNQPQNITAFRHRIDSTFGRGRMHDFILMMFMYGNDYIPHQPSLTGPSVSVVMFTEAYKELNLPLVVPDPAAVTENKRLIIDRKNLQIFFDIMADKEEFLLRELAKDYRSSENEFQLITDNVTLDAQKRMIAFDFHQFRVDWYTRVLEAYYPEKLNEGRFEDHIQDLIQKMTTNYIDMLQWTLDYYQGDTDNLSWQRAYPYAFAPLFCDLADSNRTIRASVDDSDAISPTGVSSASIIRQLLMVIHPKILPKFVPQIYARLVTDPDPKVSVLAKFSPNEPQFFADGHSEKEKHLWYSVLPIVDIDSYDEAIAAIKARGRSDLPDYMNLRQLPLIRRTNQMGEVTVIRSTPKPKPEDSKYIWVKRQLM